MSESKASGGGGGGGYIYTKFNVELLFTSRALNQRTPCLLRHTTGAVYGNGWHWFHFVCSSSFSHDGEGRQILQFEALHQVLSHFGLFKDQRSRWLAVCQCSYWYRMQFRTLQCQLFIHTLTDRTALNLQKMYVYNYYSMTGNEYIATAVQLQCSTAI